MTLKIKTWTVQLPHTGPVAVQCVCLCVSTERKTIVFKGLPQSQSLNKSGHAFPESSLFFWQHEGLPLECFSTYVLLLKLHAAQNSPKELQVLNPVSCQFSLASCYQNQQLAAYWTVFKAKVIAGHLINMVGSDWPWTHSHQTIKMLLYNTLKHTEWVPIGFFLNTSISHDEEGLLWLLV